MGHKACMKSEPRATSMHGLTLTFITEDALFIKSNFVRLKVTYAKTLKTSIVLIKNKIMWFYTPHTTS